MPTSLSPRLTPRITRQAIFRFATGVGISATLAFTLAWPLAFIAPLLVSSILSGLKPAPGLKGVIAVLLAIALIFGVGMFLSAYVYLYPLVFLLVFSWLLYLVFFASAQGKPPFIILLYLMGLMMLPLLGADSTEIASTVSGGFLLSALVAMFSVLIADLVFPVDAAVEDSAEPPSRDEAIKSAWLSLGVVLPLALVCLSFNLSGALLPLLMVALLSQKPDFSVGVAGGRALIAANLAGGIVAVIFYQLLLITPTLPFLILGLIGLALLFGQKIFSNDPMAPLWASAFSTVLVLIGSGTGAFGAEADSKFYQRIILITLAVCYVVGALSLFQLEPVKRRWLNLGNRLHNWGMAN